ncbi:hypothetical protein JTB14_037156 [Gonioctena quinquepunctata]|nr:hypothetical protein JTB14_037156 [Gonioctena quinquepunctata]
MPLDRSQVLKMLPSTYVSSESNQPSGATTPVQSSVAAIHNFFEELLKAPKHQEVTEPRKHQVKVAVELRKRVFVIYFAIPADPDYVELSISGTGTNTDNASTSTKNQKLSASRNS